jgi:hypothetical protein
MLLLELLLLLLLLLPLRMGKQAWRRVWYTWQLLLLLLRILALLLLLLWVGAAVDWGIAWRRVCSRIGYADKTSLGL